MNDGKRLGRGLEALLGPINKEVAAASGALRDLPVGSIDPNPYQPRTTFNEEALAELTESIRASGLLQPIVVRQEGSRYQLIAGERRWRAVQRLGWQSVPAVLKTADDRTLLTLALIENLQRNDLSAIDEALGYERMQREFEMPLAEVARLVGRNRSTVSNLLRLLRLPEEVRQMVHAGKLSEGHARALLMLPDDAAMRQLAERAVAEGWSVREMENEAKGAVVADATSVKGAAKKGAKGVVEGRIAPADARRVEEALRKRLGTDVRLSTRRKGRGFLTISYFSNDDLARLLELMLGEPFAG